MTAITNRRPEEAGFTLIELSIVLVIIGLIVGGILVGQDMIKAATIRSVVKQVESYNTAMNTFRDKYGAMPGDATPARVTQFNLPGATSAGIRDGAAGHGDGDGILSSCIGTGAAAQRWGCEVGWLWNDLSFAQLIPDNLNNTTNAPAAPTPAIPSGSVLSFLPKTRLRDTAVLTSVAMNGRNYFYLGGISAAAVATATAGGAYTTGNAVTVREASDIDSKVDDGAPLTGTVIAQTTAPGTIAVAAAPAAGVCVSNATGSPYNTANGGNFLEEQNCQLAIRQQ